MSDDEGRLANFVDLLAREHLLLLVPSIVASFLAAMLFQVMVARHGHTSHFAFRPSQIGVFATTLIDSANIVSALTFDRFSIVGRFQIVGAFFHVIASFFWRMVLNGLSGTNNDKDGISEAALYSSAFVVIGEILEAVAVILTLRHEFLVPAICIVCASGVLGTAWFCVVCCAVPPEESNRHVREEYLNKMRCPVVFIGEVLYTGTITIATVQNRQNIFLLFPQVPFDLLEFSVINYRKAESVDEEEERDVDVDVEQAPRQ